MKSISEMQWDALREQILYLAFIMFPGLKITSQKHGIEVVFTEAKKDEVKINHSVVKLKKLFAKENGKVFEMVCGLYFADDDCKPYLFVKKQIEGAEEFVFTVTQE